MYGVPKRIRTVVAAVKGQCPRPLDDGDIEKKVQCSWFYVQSSNLELWTLNVHWWSQAGSNRRPLHCQCSALPAELWPLESARLYVTPHFLSSVYGHNPALYQAGKVLVFFQLI